ncbi:MAG: hypothetical protein JST01_06165 [Cyanobacteria bacterium SZAS TMP-1]|nr:hypothetical protein [Cyanobacteria bacterium SZAS TMP-1]
MLAILIAFSPAQNNTPLFDESYLLAWLKHCLGSGLTAADTTAYLLAPAADARDGLTMPGAASTLFFAALSGVNYQLLRFLQLVLHTGNALLLGLALIGCLSNQEEQDEEAPRMPTICLAFAAALFFGISPLAPEAASWLFGLPVQWATFLILLSTAGLMWCDRLDGQNSSRGKIALLIIAAAGVGAPWISLRAGLAFLLPLALLATKFSLQKSRRSRPLVLVMALIALSGLAAQIFSYTQAQPIPETIESLKIEKIALDDEGKHQSLLEAGPAANLQAILLPVNRNIDTKYNKVLRFLYFFLPLPLLFFLLALVTSGTMRALGLTTLAATALGALACGAGIDSQNFYGARWLYPLLPLTGIFWACLCLSPLYINAGEGLRHKVALAIRYCITAALILALGVFFCQRTYRQNLSYKSNGKLWQVIKQAISAAGQKETSPFIIVRGLPQSLSIAPILSPFSPQLLDTQSGLPRSTSMAAGRLKHALAVGNYRGLLMHWEKQWNAFAGTDLNIVDTPFPGSVPAAAIAGKLSPPLMYYHGAIKLDGNSQNLLMESHSKIGPALRLQGYGLGPLDGDFLYAEAKIDVPQSERAKADNRKNEILELHWLTNWQGDWDGRDRKVTTSGPASDGQYHRYYFPLNTLAWTTSGLPTNLMLGFPAHSTVALKSIGLCREALPSLKITAVHRADNNHNYFSHFCLNYPDVDELGLCAVYGHDNALNVQYDVKAIAGASEAIIEVVPAEGALHDENSAAPLPQSFKFTEKATSGELKITADQLHGSGIYSVRVFAAGADHKIIGHSSDSLKCLIDPTL